MKIRGLPRQFAVGRDMPMRASGSPSAHSSALADGPLSAMAEMPGTAKSVVEGAEWTRGGQEGAARIYGWDGGVSERSQWAL